MPTIRPYQPKDKENVRAVCIATGPREAAEPGAARTMLLATYCDYYVECEPENCFVIADDNDEAVGYILCARDCQSYRKRFLSEYLPRVKGLPLFKRGECRASAFLPLLFREAYPAHLHIDILEAYQRQGLGSALMNALTVHLRAEGVRGVMLGVGSYNTGAQRFYARYGFKKLMRLPYSVAMGLEL